MRNESELQPASASATTPSPVGELEEGRPPETLATPPTARHRSRGLRWASAVLVVGAVAGALWLWNEIAVAGPVAHAVEGDMRDERFAMEAHYGYYVDPSTLVLDLRHVEGGSPAGVFRALFNAADTLAALDVTVNQVELANRGTPIFVLKGGDFRALGRARRAGENPVYLFRTLPEKLRHPSTLTPAYGTWEGGWLGVLSHQMEDVADAGRTWLRG